MLISKQEIQTKKQKSEAGADGLNSFLFWM